MGNKRRQPKEHRQRRVRVRGIRRDEPDLKKLAHALVELSAAQAEAEARAEHKSKTQRPEGDAA